MGKEADTSEDALERLRAATRANPRSTAFVALAHRLCDAGNPQEAEDVCREGLNQHPGLVTGQVALGRALFERGRIREAQDLLIDAAKGNPDNGDAFKWLAEVVVKRGDLARARAVLEYAEELSPYDTRVAELLVEAGGTPTFRAPRLQSDFEHTKVANARAIAEKMFNESDEEHQTRPPDGPPLEPTPDPSSIERVDDPTVVDGRAAVKAWLASGAKGAPPRPQDANAPRPSGAMPPIPAAAHGASASSPTGSGRASPVPGQAVPGPAVPVASAPLPLSAALPTMGDPPARRRMVAVGAGVALIVGILVLALVRRPPPAARDLRAEMRGALTTGSLRALLHARDLGRQILTASSADGDTAARLAFVHALLARDYGLPSERDAEAALGRAQSAGAATPARTALVEATRSLLALGHGEPEGAGQHARRAVAAAPDAIEPIVAAARVQMQLGDLEAARKELERGLAKHPTFSTAITDWATVWLDLGDPSAAAQSLRALLARVKDHTRARILLAEAQRALCERPDVIALEAACREEGKQSHAILAGCALAAAAEARLAGERTVAVKGAKAAAVEAAGDPRLLASAALSLAVLGEIDAAADALQKAKQLARPTAIPLAWADLAVRLGRAAGPPPDRPLDSESGPERRLVAARAAYARGSTPALGAALRTIRNAYLAYDRDLRSWTFFGRGPTAGRNERAEVERRADKGDPVAAYVLGRLAEQAGDHKVAARRLESALWGHGDACAAAAAYTRAMTALDRPVAAAVFRPLRAQNASCRTE